MKLSFTTVCAYALFIDSLNPDPKFKTLLGEHKGMASHGYKGVLSLIMDNSEEFIKNFALDRQIGILSNNLFVARRDLNDFVEAGICPFKAEQKCPLCPSRGVDANCSRDICDAIKCYQFVVYCDMVCLGVFNTHFSEKITDAFIKCFAEYLVRLPGFAIDYCNANDDIDERFLEYIAQDGNWIFARKAGGDEFHAYLMDSDRICVDESLHLGIGDYNKLYEHSPGNGNVRDLLRHMVRELYNSAINLYVPRDFNVTKNAHAVLANEDQGGNTYSGPEYAYLCTVRHLAFRFGIDSTVKGAEADKQGRWEDILHDNEKMEALAYCRSASSKYIFKNNLEIFSQETNEWLPLNRYAVFVLYSNDGEKPLTQDDTDSLTIALNEIIARADNNLDFLHGKELIMWKDILNQNTRAAFFALEVVEQNTDKKIFLESLNNFENRLGRLKSKLQQSQSRLSIRNARLVQLNNNPV